MRTLLLLSAAIMVFGLAHHSAAAEELPSSYFNYTLGEKFNPAKDEPPLGPETKYSYPKWPKGQTWGLREVSKTGTGVEMPYPLATVKGKKYYVIAGEISVNETGKLSIISLNLRVSPKENSWKAVEESLMKAYGQYFYDKKEMSGGIYNQLKFRDAEKELWVGYGNGSREMEIKIFLREKTEG